MAYWFNNNIKYNGAKQVQFFMDSDSDVSDLPTSASSGEPQGDTVTHLPVGKGSSAKSIDSGKIYILDSSDNWTELGGGD